MTPTGDRLVVRMVVGLIGLVTLTSLVLVGFLALKRTPIPEALVATLSGGLGAMSALLAKTSSAEPGAVEPVPVVPVAPAPLPPVQPTGG